MFLEIGSTEEYWKRQDAAQVMALLMWEGLGLGEGAGIGDWNSENDKKKVLLGIGGGHYAPRHMDVVKKNEGVWLGHLLSGYTLPMEDPNQTKGDSEVKEIGGTWKQAIMAAYEATVSAFPGGEILAHLDHKSFKGWQKNAITGFLAEQSRLFLVVKFWLILITKEIRGVVTGTSSSFPPNGRDAVGEILNGMKELGFRDFLLGKFFRGIISDLDQRQVDQ